MYFYAKRKLNVENNEIFNKFDKSILSKIDLHIKRCCQYGYYHYNNVAYDCLCNAIEQLIVDHYCADDPCDMAIYIMEMYFPSHADWLNDDEE